jgi:hypothetical protein
VSGRVDPPRMPPRDDLEMLMARRTVRPKVLLISFLVYLRSALAYNLGKPGAPYLHSHSRVKQGRL